LCDRGTNSDTERLSFIQCVLKDTQKIKEEKFKRKEVNKE